MAHSFPTRRSSDLANYLGQTWAPDDEGDPNVVENSFVAGQPVGFPVGVGAVLPWAFLHWGWASLAQDPGALQIAVEVVVLLVWNDIHFYANHRLLHTKALRRFHQQHHRSLVTTPFATYSFHPLEAALLGNVILLPMLLHDFSFAALLSLPVCSLLLNNLGHSNYDYAPGVGHHHWLAASRRHHLHHACYHGNYGFLFNFMDGWFGTRLPDDASRAQLEEFRARAAAR